MAQVAPPEAQANDMSLSEHIDEVKLRWNLKRNAESAPPVLLDAKTFLEMSSLARGVLSSSLQDHKRDRPYFPNFGYEVSMSQTKQEDLEPITIKDMKLNRVHQGRSLLCRVLGGHERNIATEMIIEDTNGNGVSLFMHHFFGLFQASSDLIKAMFPIGQILLIREPWLTDADTTKDFTIIRVDSPSDIIFLSGLEPVAKPTTWTSPEPHAPYIQQSPLDLKALGAAYFKSSAYIPAARVWSIAIQKDANIPELYLNRAQAYISLEWFEAALRDAEHVQQTFPNSPLVTKAAFRAGNALYGLGRYREAVAKFKGLLDPASRDWVGRCIQRVKEAEKGDFDWMQMYKLSQSETPRLDVADFTGAVEVQALPRRGGGRGVVATRDLKTGELLVVAKPFASVYRSELLKTESLGVLNFFTNESLDPDRFSLFHAIITKLHGRPERVDEIFNLYSGAQYPHSPSYDTTSRKDVHLETPLVPPLALDITRIGSILTRNVFTMPPLRAYAANKEREDGLGIEKTGSSLHMLPSLFNHSCHSNAAWRSFGDVITVRAMRNIPAGTEITLPYVASYSYDERTKALGVLLDGATCDCDLCAWDRADGEATCRSRNLAAAVSVDELVDFRTHIVRIEKLKRIIESVKRTYAGSEPGRTVHPTLYTLHHLASSLIASQFLHLTSDQARGKALADVITYACQALSYAGYVSVEASFAQGTAAKRRTLPMSKRAVGSVGCPYDECVGLMVTTSGCFVSLNNDLRAERWLRAAWWAHSVEYGSSQALFNARFGNLIKTCGFPQYFLNSFEYYGWD